MSGIKNWMRPNNHLNEQGCPYCGGTKKRTQEEFIERAKKVHGDKYDLSKVRYVNMHTKIVIICPKHGEFLILPGHFINGVGCKKCFDEKKKELYTKPFEKFVEEAREIHGDKYDYSKVEYINTGTKVCIVCPIHGEFWQSPHNHLGGNGCPECKKVYLNKIKTKRS